MEEELEKYRRKIGIFEEVDGLFVIEMIGALRRCIVAMVFELGCRLEGALVIVERKYCICSVERRQRIGSQLWEDSGGVSGGRSAIQIEDYPKNCRR